MPRCLACGQVILIHLSNITGLKDEYSKRTMMLLVSDIGTIVMGVTAALCYAWPKVPEHATHNSLPSLYCARTHLVLGAHAYALASLAIEHSCE